MERKKKKQQSDNDSGSDSKLNSLSSGGNDMKPVIYRRRGGGRDQMTNYIGLWSLKQCTLGSGAGHRMAEPGHKGSDHPAEECSEQAPALILVSISDSAGGGQVCVCSRGWMGNSGSGFFFLFCFFFLSLRVFKAFLIISWCQTAVSMRAQSSVFCDNVCFSEQDFFSFV